MEIIFHNRLIDLHDLSHTLFVCLVHVVSLSIDTAWMQTEC